MRTLTLASAALMLSIAPEVASAATLYLCKSYSGGLFWSSAACGAQQATELVDPP